MITFKQYLQESTDELSTINMIAGMYRNLHITIHPITISHHKSKFNGMKNCFYNSEMNVKKNHNYMYVLGFVTVHEVPIEHAWIKTSAGEYLDPTINNPEDYNYYSCLELSKEELLYQIKHTKSKPGYIDLATLNRYSK